MNVSKGKIAVYRVTANNNSFNVNNKLDFDECFHPAFHKLVAQD